MTITLSTFTVSFDANCSVEQLWDLMMTPELHSGWLDSVDGIEKRTFDADMSEGGHIVCDYTIGGGKAIRHESRILGLVAPTVQSIAIDTSYDGRIGIAALARVAIVPRGEGGSRVLHTETAHFLNGETTPEQHRDFIGWWYSVTLRQVAAA